MAGRSRFQALSYALTRDLRAAVWLLLALSIASFLLLPFFASKCYLDEKALLVGGSFPSSRQSGTLEACLTIHHQLLTQQHQQPPTFPSLVHAAAAAAAAPPLSTPLRFYTGSFNRSSGLGSCRTMHAVVRTPRGEGAEGYVLFMPLDTRRPAAAALAAAVGVAAAGHLRRSGWLAKDFVLVFADVAACSEEESSEAWMAAYSSPLHLFSYPRAGLLQQALVLQIAGPQGAAGGGDGASSAEVSVHGVGGLLPNLDLYYLIKRNLELHTALPIGLRAAEGRLPPLAGRAAAALGGAAAALGLLPPAAAQRYASELHTLAAFAGQLASGRGTGAHSAFLEHQVDAATLALRFPAAASAHAPGSAGAAGTSAKAHQRTQAAAAASLAAVEMVLRTFNNLQERLHHSTAVYALVSSSRFVGVAALLAPPACALLAALVQLVATARAATATSAAARARSAWRAAWRRLAAACSAVAALSAVLAAWGGPSGSSAEGSSPEAPSSLWQQLLWICLAGFVAAEGCCAWQRALELPESSSGSCVGGATGGAEGGSNGTNSKLSSGGHTTSMSDVDGSSLTRQCVQTAALAVAALQGAHLLLSSCMRCWLFLLCVVPLHAALSKPTTRSLLHRTFCWCVILGAAAALWRLSTAVSALWLAELAAPHLLLLATS